MKRAVITGFGIISSIGNNKEEVLASLKAGKSGIEVMPEFIEMKILQAIIHLFDQLSFNRLKISVLL